MIYAVIESGGKQYSVSAGQTLDVELIPQDVGSDIELDRVLLVSEANKVIIGQPVIDGAKVKATVVEHGRGKKITVFKYKSKTRYRVKTGHRQSYTRLAINEIVLS